MFPNNNFIKEEDHSQGRNPHLELQPKGMPIQLHDYYPQPLHPYQVDPYTAPQMKKQQLEQPMPTQSQHYINNSFQQPCQKVHCSFDDQVNRYLLDGIFQQNFVVRKPWYMGNYCDDYYSMRVKKEQIDDGRFWQGSIKDEESILNQQGLQPVEVKQQEMALNKFQHEDLNEFFGPSFSIKDQKKQYRKLRVERFLQKKKLRSFQKKITYKCRKQVAENRIRHKGRFISLKQAIQILNLNPEGKYTMQDVKKLFTEAEDPKAKLEEEKIDLNKQ